MAQSIKPSFNVLSGCSICIQELLFISLNEVISIPLSLKSPHCVSDKELAKKIDKISAK